VYTIDVVVVVVIATFVSEVFMSADVTDVSVISM